MSAHTVTIDFEDGDPNYTFNCEAPADAMCHADFTCDCDVLWGLCVRNGVPAHQPDPQDQEWWHAGTFNPDACNLKDWFDADDDGPLRGTITVPVVATDDGYDGYQFDIEEPQP